MLFWQITFWISLVILTYSYLGYFGILTFWSAFYKGKPKTITEDDDLPEITHIIAAYNEEEIILEKIENTLNLDYPKDKIRNIIVADGSDDRTVELIKKFDQIEIFYQKERKGKLASINRMIPLTTTEIVFFSDANTVLSENSLKEMTSHFSDEDVGSVSGEKKVYSEVKDDASGSGESMYWKYESYIKYCEAKISSTVGAAGELFAIRKELYENPPNQVLVEDLMITMSVIKKGFKIAYEPNAIATEKPSKSVREEMKRKVRISSGGIQSIPFLMPYLNFFKYGSISFFLLSHRFMRWLFAPIALLLLLISSLFLLGNENWMFATAFYSQLLFYGLAFFGFLFSDKQLGMKFLFVPFYFVFMHVCIIIGYKKALFYKVNLNWEKSERRS